MSLQLVRVTREFGARAAVHRAVDDVSLDIEPGTFCTLLGPSGCGKTTLLRLIAGFEQPTSGDILHDGRSLNGVPPYRRNFPMVFQSYALFPHMTVLQNVAYGLRLRELSRDDVRTRAQRALALLGLEPHQERRPAQLSGGQQQRVALARCLVLEPSMILLDEPLSNLDAALRVEMRREIRALQQRLGITAVYVTHDQEEAMAVSDRVVVLDHGRVQQDGTPADIWQRPATEFVARFMGAANVLPFTRTPSGITLLGADYPVHAPTAATAVVLRPDAITLRAHGTHPGRVVERTFLGGRTQYVVALTDGTRVTVESPSHAADDHVAFDIAAAALHFV